MSKILNLIQFDEVKIEKKKNLESYVYKATLKKQVVFQLLSKDNLIKLDKFEAESKQFVILGILSGKILEECDADDIEYFTELKNQMENMPQEVDDYLWSIGLKRREKTNITHDFDNCQSNVCKKVITDLKTREAKGIDTYGTTLDRTDLTRSEWLQHAYEEALDLALYLKKLKIEEDARKQN
jgi:hypothetical protein